ncbi:DUF262 domain-containing HNH endonuclease family protein [Paraburkholderia sp. FT54]|uniref:DUF262 domain-containing protein n=1 Tax=Paraburkholderia sp. FT54 TaxID=3074437 RepID=UPI002877D398|nr:DUF262 domain-containing HNH endonuclease family protein [Paraburkholderia sp. FT54]WNC90232.1 DUF262 domain-containing HNH endonuclease family protein [Paraburkholderia sp. FT54]
MSGQSSTGNIDSGKVILREVFEKFWFTVPDYQRAYVWGKDEVDELVDDIAYAADHNESGQYFLGSMVLQRKSETFDFQGTKVTFDNSYDLLDGQQRLTTLFLLLAVIRDKTTEDDIKSTCQSMLAQKESKARKTPGRTRLLYKIRDDVEDFIRDYVAVPNGTLEVEALRERCKSDVLSLSSMAKNLGTLDEKLSTWSHGQLDQFAIYLMNQVVMIYVASDDLDDAFRLFTILNDRGIPLSNSDILKAQNLGAIRDGKEKAKYARFWEQTEGEFGRDEFDRFLSFIRTVLVQDKAREGLLKEFDERIYKADPPLLTRGVETMELVRDYKNAYNSLILFNPLPEDLGIEFRNRITVMLSGLPSTDWVPPVLQWYRKFGTNGLNEFLLLLENKFSADWVLQLTPTFRIQNMSEILRATTSAKSVEEVLRHPTIFSYQKSELQRLVQEDVYSRRYAKYLLLRLELLKHDHSAIFNGFDYISIEHVCPQNPGVGSKWRDMFPGDIHANWVDKLGNLVLLSRRKNSSLSNLEFLEKKKRYFEGSLVSFPNSLRVMLLSEFDVQAVSHRHTEVTSALLASY